MSKKRNPIKCTFFGYTLAETKRNKIIRFLKKNNYDFEETYDYKIIVRDITFEGFHCKKVKLDFCRETIWSIDADLGVFEDENRLYRYCPWMRGMATSQISCNNGIDKKASHVPL